MENVKRQIKYKYIGHAYARLVALALLFFCCCLTPTVVAQTSVTQGQGYFTLTNGRLWWSNGLENQDDELWRDPVAFDSTRFDTYGNPMGVHPHGNDHVTHITAQGDTYLALDITTTGSPAHPKLVSVSHNDFSIYCVWYRTGYTGYYYQEHYNNADQKTYRYYIVASSSEGLSVVSSEVGQPLEKSTYFYNWDFGAAIWEKPTINGAPQDRYYWIMFAGYEANGTPLSTREWRLSKTCYQRPEDIYYKPYTEGDDAANAENMRYYDDVSDISQVNGYDITHAPAGNGALHMPVAVILHDKEILSREVDEEGVPYGLQNQTRGEGITLGATTLAYDLDNPPGTSLTAVMKYKNGDKVPMTVRPAYAEYVEETYRRGIHLNYRNRGSEGVYGSAGVATTRTHYYWNDALHTAAPSDFAEQATVDTIIFSVDNRSRRYVSIDPIARMNTSPRPATTTLRYNAPVSGTHTVEVYVKVRYSNGVEECDTTTLTLTFDKPEITPEPVNGPVVRGAVYGGGRMANVGGNTAVTIHGADSIQTLYGGNDIAGWVQGTEGATLQIGTEFTSSHHPVHIGNVYGGGNGYYTYQGINAGYDEATSEHFNPYYHSQSTALIYQAYYFNGKVYPWNTLPNASDYYSSNDSADAINHRASAWNGLEAVVDHEFNYTPFYIGRPDLVDQAETGDDGDGTIPYIKTAHITVGVPEGSEAFLTSSLDSTHKYNDYIIIDTLFGGSRNAFIGVDAKSDENPESAVSIDINGGTCYAVFGGNNVGGSVANKSMVNVNVNDTKLVGSDEDVNSTFLSGYGRNFGIRYLFGGGNLVDGAHANVIFRGGMIDTAFLGGNNATVKNPIGTVECLSGSLNPFGYKGHFICTNPSYPSFDSLSGGPLAKYDSSPDFFDDYGPENLETGNGKYNINCLFGGNNAADMANLTTIQLHSGGIGTVYGGGNVGDMTNDTRFDVPVAGTNDTLRNQLFPQALYNQLFLQAYDINADSTMIAGGWAKNYGVKTLPQKIGTIVTALPNSNIVCDYVFGGSRMGNVKNSCGVYLAGGIYGYVNGGNDISGDVGSETGGGTYTVLDGNALVVGYAVAGSDGFYHCEDDKEPWKYGEGDLYDAYGTANETSYDPYHDYVGLLFPTHNNVNLYMRGGLVLGQVLAGGTHADVGFPQRVNYIRKLDTVPTSPTYGKRVEQPIDLTVVGGTQRGSIHFMAKGGRVLGEVFGGGYQSNINGLSYLTLRGNTKINGSFFSGNDCTGSIRPLGAAYFNTNDFDTAFANNGGDSAAAYAAAYAAMEASDGTKLNKESGSWNADVSAYLRIEDSVEVGSVYGSGNGAYNYDGERPQYDVVSYCSGTGTLTPKQSSSFIDIHTSGGKINTVFGGGNGVGVEEKVVVLLNNTANDVHTVRTIFGGNNVDNMKDVVPEIRLTQGIVNTVFGGANNGIMGAKWRFTDAIGNEVNNVSTHVVLESPNVTVLDTIFGGNRMSDVEGGTFVEVHNTKDDGVSYVFGGNDISGNITGYTRVDVGGGVVKNIFGGSDGRYDFVEIGDNLFNIYNFGFVDRHPSYFDGTEPNAPALTDSLITIAGRPDVDSTSINIWGGTVGVADGGVYGGGSMADCRATSVVVNDTANGGNGNAIIYGSVYGGGMGDYEDLNNRNLQGNRYGNISEATHVELHHAGAISSAKAYGGGRGGDVMNTYITTYDGWDTPFDSLYGGCWGSDVFGTTHVTMNGKLMGEGSYNVKNLFGGNDFAGDVYKALVTVNSGRYLNIYGAGNGDYPLASYTTGEYAGVGKNLHRPNTEYVNLTFNDGIVDNNLYGGGKLGTTFAYQKNHSTHEYNLVNGHKVPDTTLNRDEAHTDPLDYSYVITNIHGGTIYNNVFGGASGRSSYGETPQNALVYGLKVVNMDDGEIRMSLYGGSESVNDGYRSECVAESNSTLRPSSIINMTGGLVESNLYGAGYLGTTHGSVYVNIGSDAIDSCAAYSAVFPVGGSEDSAYHIFKPGVEGGLSPALDKSNLVLNHSVYAGANWGAGAGNATFFIEGFQGGESLINIDGRGYNTSYDELNALPQMNVKKSLFGSGTSVKGGDKRTEITLRNYGEMDENCHPTRELESVQRADKFFSHNTAVHYLGATDAATAYISEPYSILRVEDVAFRGFNVAEYESSVNKVWELHFYEEELDDRGELELVPVQPLREVASSDEACGPTATVCGSTSMVSATDTDKKHTLLVLNNGIDFDVQNEINGNVTGGYVKGFGYVTTPVGYSSSIIAYPTAIYYDDDGEYYSYEDWEYDELTDGYSGFVSTCDTTNRYTTDRSLLTSDWVADGEEGYDASQAELPYTNYLNDDVGYLNYREWKIGQGIRLRETAILAHADPTKLEQDVSTLINGEDLALAKASIALPATSTGHYYKLDPNGVIIKGSSSMVNMVDEAWYTDAPFETLGDMYENQQDVGAQGVWKQANLDENGVVSGHENIVNYPDNTFGLLMVPGENFLRDGDTLVMPSDTLGESLSHLVLSGNAYYNASSNYCSPKVATGERIMPTMNFLLTYNPDFATTFMGTVDFILNEYDNNDNLVGPVQVRVYLSTIIEEFRDIETNVLAMFNNDVSNTFTRRVILPVTIDENRELYITSVQWVPVDGDGEDRPDSNYFYLTEKDNTITEATPHTVNNLFGLRLIPNDAVTGELNENLGWSAIDRDTINIFTLAHSTGSAPQKFAAANNGTVSFTEGGSNGLRIGVLDGRGSAALNVNLSYDGSRIYRGNSGRGYIGKAKLGMKWVKGDNSGNFDFTIYVKTRAHGDTIYLASAEEVTRDGMTVNSYRDQNSYYNELMRSGNSDSVAKAPTVIGKTPDCHVLTFQHALSSNVYQEGDVIAIIDTVKINSRPVHIQGADGPPIQVIRYDGHHHELPSDTGGVYRGPMIVVEGAGILFTAQNIDFHGSAGALVKRVKRNASGAPILDGSGRMQFVTRHSIGGHTYAQDKIPDTNRAFAPIIVVKNQGAVTLLEGTNVRHNWNGYGYASGQTTAEGLPADPTRMGAISVTSGGTLSLKGDVTISDNLCHTMPFDLDGDPLYSELRPGNGAVYINGGKMVLPQSHSSTAVDVTHNMLMDPDVHGAHPEDVSWWQLKFIEGKPSRYALDTNLVYNQWQRANVYLTRTAPTTGTDAEKELYDRQSDVISVSGTLGTHTRIGVRKWFPGITTRDTIQIAVNTSQDFTVMGKVQRNGNFQSDDNFRTFYSQDVNNLTDYLFRCATFRHQQEGVSLPVAIDGYTPGDVLHYGILERNSCPVGGDTLIYRLQGGFAPYTYIWTGDMTRTYTTPYPNTVVQNGLNHGNPDYYLASIADTLLTTRVDMAYNERSKVANITVKAVDATGECELSKSVKITLHKVGDLESHSLWEPVTTPNDGWSSTAANDTAVGDRYYKAVKVTPYVWTDAANGKISAMVAKDNGTYDRIIYKENGDEGHGLDTLLFCEGDVIRLKTQPTYAGAQFLMWSFDPFNENPATYVVPPHDDEVIAYYGSKIYWSDTIDLPEEAGVANATSYTYRTRPEVNPYKLISGNSVTNTTKAGYVTTYNGDVHIYNENGLAWFISIVNGLNGFQARPFAFNAVYLHKKSDGTAYNMMRFLWSPVGSRQYGFRGRFIGVGSGDNDTTSLTGDDRVIIKNIVLNEPYMDYVGFFGLLESASCKGIGLQDIFVRGGQYVGGFAAQANSSTMDNCAVVSDPTKTETTSIIATNYVSGGMVGNASNSTIKNSKIHAKYTGNAVHSGGITGVGQSDIITNNSSRVDDHMNGVYVGGITGNETSEEDPDCNVSSLSASVAGMTDNGYFVNASWIASTRRVYVGWSYGDSWQGSEDDMTPTRDSRISLTIPIPTDTVSDITIAVKPDCSDDSAIRTISVSLDEIEEIDECPTYEVSAIYRIDSSQATHLSHVVDVMWQNVSNYSEDSVELSLCLMNEDGSYDDCVSATVAANSNEANGLCSYTINIDRISNADIMYYVVRLMSWCNEVSYETQVSTAVSDNQGRYNPTGRNRNRKRRSGGRSLIANNYVQIVGNSKAQRVGGIAGRTSNTDILNNYVYGVVGGRETGGSVAAVLDQGTRAVNNYAAHGTAGKLVGHQLGGMLSNTARFEGQGNRVLLDKRIHGMNNLTRILNKWVSVHNAEGGQYLTWRSDLEEENNGYPLFGDPDMVPVDGFERFDGCEEVVFNGVTYTRDTVIIERFIDSVEMVDSTLTATIRLHHSTYTNISDSALMSDGYSGHGFSITAAELRLLNLTLDSAGHAFLVLTDTLTTEFGCDSIVTLALVFTGDIEEPAVVTVATVKVYPNPTTGWVNVETEEMSHVEVYDNEGRRLQDYDANGSSKITIDMTTFATGIYFVRVHTPEGVLIQKVIKER